MLLLLLVAGEGVVFGCVCGVFVVAVVCVVFLLLLLRVCVCVSFFFLSFLVGGGGGGGSGWDRGGGYCCCFLHCLLLVVYIGFPYLHLYRSSVPVSPSSANYTLIKLHTLKTPCSLFDKGTSTGQRHGCP